MHDRRDSEPKPVGQRLPVAPRALVGPRQVAQVDRKVDPAVQLVIVCESIIGPQDRMFSEQSARSAQPGVSRKQNILMCTNF